MTFLIEWGFALFDVAYDAFIDFPKWTSIQSGRHHNASGATTTDDSQCEDHNLLILKNSSSHHVEIK